MADDPIQAIILRYARFNRSTGKPLKCEVGSTDQTRHSEGKIAYRSVKAAQHAAAEMERLGRDPQAVYECPRSRRGHAHTTRRDAPRAPDPDRRPEDVPVLPVPSGDELCIRCGRPWRRPEGTPEDDRRYCPPSCRSSTRKKVKRRAYFGLVMPLVHGTVLERERWSEEFRLGVRKVTTAEEATALVAAEIARIEAAGAHHS